MSVISTGEEPRGRSVIMAHTMIGGPCTLMIARFGLGNSARVIVSHHGVGQTSAVLTMDQADELIAAIEQAKSPRPES